MPVIPEARKRNAMNINMTPAFCLGTFFSPRFRNEKPKKRIFISKLKKQIGI